MRFNVPTKFNTKTIRHVPIPINELWELRGGLPNVDLTPPNQSIWRFLNVLIWSSRGLTIWPPPHNLGFIPIRLNDIPCFICPKFHINPAFSQCAQAWRTRSTHGNWGETIFKLIFAGRTMIEQNSQEGEIFAVFTLDKFYDDLTPLSNTNPMVQS